MNILLRSKFYAAFGGDKNIGGGLISALENQRKMLTYMGIPFTEDIKADWDIMQINIPWPVALREATWAKKHGKKVVMWSHVTVEDLEKSIRIFKHIPGLRSIVRAYLAFAYRHADLVLCPTHYTKNLLIGYGLPEEKLYVQTNAVDTSAFYADAQKRHEYRATYSLSGIVVGNVSIAIPRKGIDTFSFLAQTFSTYEFIWFGKMFPSLFVDNGALQEASSHVQFTGFVQDATAALNALDIFLFPSYEENQGMVILEAAAVGLPILVRDLPVYADWLEDGVNCLKAKDESEFVSQLKRLIDDEQLRIKLGEAALQLAQKESIESQAASLQKAYDRILAE